MKPVKVLIAILITASLVSAFWLNYHANLRQKTKDMNEQIYALQQEKYEQRKEIAQFHRQETELLREIARLKMALERKSTQPAKYRLHSLRSNSQKPVG
jgi:peptidoglycan hydrolase CwlO-like protein